MTAKAECRHKFRGLLILSNFIEKIYIRKGQVNGNILKKKTKKKTKKTKQTNKQKQQQQRKKQQPSDPHIANFEQFFSFVVMPFIVITLNIFLFDNVC